MPQYVCAVNKEHTKYFALPVAETMHCCGKPMIEQGVQRPAAPVMLTATSAPAGSQRGAKKWWQFWN
jgi:hypothetical protein